MQKIRNFSIIAHIDHGKSTLADRLLEHTGTLTKREMSDRVMDTLELEQEKGITIKLQSARMEYKDHILNLIDTPGHVDFSYEVVRSLVASEGALLLVDATQGIQAQTFTTVYKALENDLEIIPVINKVDLPAADPEKIIDELNANFGFTKDEVILASAKTGLGVENILDAIIERIPAPEVKSQLINDNNQSNPLRAFIFDSFYHEYKGVVVLCKLVSGNLRKDNEIFVINSELNLDPVEIGYLKPKLTPQSEIHQGEVGYIATGLKDIRKIHVGDTITLATESKNNISTLPGYNPPKPMVFASIFPTEANEFPDFQEALEKLALNDAALTFTKEHSQALGSGFNCGFLGLLHLEVSQERLEREFDLDLVVTPPSVEYLITTTSKDMSKFPNVNVSNFDENGILHVRAAGEFPDQSLIDSIEEPISSLEIITPDKYIGNIMELAEKHRGEYKSMEYVTSSAGNVTTKHVILKYMIPTAEIMTDFFDKLKSITQGYASMDYETRGYVKSDIVKLEIFVNHEPVDALSFLTHRSNAEGRGRAMVKKLIELIPKQQFKIPIQAALGSKVIARETIAALRKDVTAKLYGGDITRKKKLLEKQKKGKKRLAKFGHVEIPKNAFLAALSTDE